MAKTTTGLATAAPETNPVPTEPQFAALKADILADPVLAALPTDPDNCQRVADTYNAVAVPDFWVWKTFLSRTEIFDALVWSEMIALSVGQRDTFNVMLTEGVVNPSSANVRQGFLSIFNGPGAAGTRTNLIAVARRTATRAEKLYAIGAGTTADPATLTFTGVLTWPQVQYARLLP